MHVTNQLEARFRRSAHASDVLLAGGLTADGLRPAAGEVADALRWPAALARRRRRARPARGGPGKTTLRSRPTACTCSAACRSTCRVVDAARRQRRSRRAVDDRVVRPGRLLARAADRCRAGVAACARFAVRAACPALPSWRRRLYQCSRSAAAQLEGRGRATDPLLPRPGRAAFTSCPTAPTSVSPGPMPERLSSDSACAISCSRAGRIEPRKNQLGLIRAMRGTGVPIVVLGRRGAGTRGVPGGLSRARADRRCVSSAAWSTTTRCSAAAYAACGCLALASWFETPGLVALEAAMSGTPLVLPEGGCAREYFGDEADYVRPGDLRRDSPRGARSPGPGPQSVARRADSPRFLLDDRGQGTPETRTERSS